MTTEPALLKSPYPYFGGKSWVADIVWERFGLVQNYVEPFFGSGAMLLARPNPSGIETVNDKDGFISNFWRALQADPEAVAHYADWPVNENDLHARHIWLVGQAESMTTKLEGDAEWFDVKAAGWWVWGMSCWIGSGFCSGKGPWQVVDGALVDTRELPHLGNAGQGVNRQLPHLGSSGGGNGIHLLRRNNTLYNIIAALSERMRTVRVCSGDWSRVCGPSVTWKHGLTAVFLDPPYAAEAKRQDDLYRRDCDQIAHAAREWAVENGTNPLMRIALCGYDGEHQMPADWSEYRWSARGGFGSQAIEQTGNRHKERIWFSPHCLSESQRSLFAGVGA